VCGSRIDIADMINVPAGKRLLLALRPIDFRNYAERMVMWGAGWSATTLARWMPFLPASFRPGRHRFILAIQLPTELQGGDALNCVTKMAIAKK
jgi:hypothetical protein